VRGWLTSKPDPEFESKCADLCAVYLRAPEAAEQGVRTVSIDEMTGVQALERAAPSLPMKPGKIERRFSILARKLPRHGSFTSQQDLKERIERFIAYFNRAMAKPFKWTKTGKPLAA